MSGMIIFRGKFGNNGVECGRGAARVKANSSCSPPVPPCHAARLPDELGYLNCSGLGVSTGVLLFLHAYANKAILIH